MGNIMGKTQTFKDGKIVTWIIGADVYEVIYDKQGNITKTRKGRNV